jgi:F0F1-type ATP synthase membrane subunit b/b'
MILFILSTFALVMAIVYYFFYYKPIKNELKREKEREIQGIDFPADEPYPYDNFR